MLGRTGHCRHHNTIITKAACPWWRFGYLVTAFACAMRRHLYGALHCPQFVNVDQAIFTAAVSCACCRVRVTRLCVHWCVHSIAAACGVLVYVICTAMHKRMLVHTCPCASFYQRGSDSTSSLQNRVRACALGLALPRTSHSGENLIVLLSSCRLYSTCVAALVF